MDKIVGLGEIVISKDPEDVIKTFALASCVGITAYSLITHIAGMIHIVLPFPPSRLDRITRPGYYASTGVPLFLQKMSDAGCQKNELAVNIYGGSDAQRADDCFNIGMRNLSAVQNLLSESNIPFNLVDVGGNISRTLFMEVATGAVKINALPMLF